MRQTLSGQNFRRTFQRLDISTPGIGIGSTGLPSYGLFLQNFAPATSGLQQYSPPILFTGMGQASTPGQSQRTDWKIYLQSVLGAANPTANLLFDFGVNGGAFANKLQIASDGTLTSTAAMRATGFQIPSGANLSLAGGLTLLTANVVNWSGRSTISCPADGQLTIWNNANTDFTRLNVGGITSAFPGIGRNGIFLEFLAADGSSTASTALYNTKTSGTNFERLTNEWNTNVCRLWTEKGSGGGTARDFVLGADATELMRFQTGTKLSFFGATPVVKQTGGENVTNNVTDTASTAGTIPDIANGAVYATDYTNLRNALFQLARIAKQNHDALRAYGLLT